MQKFRFLIPLLILTLLVAVISYNVRSYSQNNGKSSQLAQQNAQGTEVTVENGVAIVTGIPQKRSLLSRIFGGTDNTSTTQPSQNNTLTPTPTKANAGFSQSQVAVPINEERTIEVMVDTGTQVPNAYTFNIQFDPNSVSISKIEPGNIWRQVAIFTKDNKIDNLNGIVRYSAAQSLGSEKADGKILLRVFLKAKSTATSGSELTILTSSKFAYAGLDREVLLESKSIQVQVTK